MLESAEIAEVSELNLIEMGLESVQKRTRKISFPKKATYVHQILFWIPGTETTFDSIFEPLAGLSVVKVFVTACPFG